MIKKLKSKLSAKGSVLVFTLIVLFIILAAAIGISSVSVLERKGARSTDVSVQSFQIANSGAEIILKKIAENPGATLSGLGNCESGTGKITGSISSGKDYEITFYNTSDGLPITDCGIAASNVDKIKSVGSYANTARAIEVAIAATDWTYLGDVAVSGTNDGYCKNVYTAGPSGIFRVSFDGVTVGTDLSWGCALKNQISYDAGLHSQGGNGTCWFGCWTK